MYENKRVKFLYKCLTWLVLLLLQMNFSSGCQLSESKSNVNCSHVSWWLRLWNLIVCWALTDIKCGLFADPSYP